MKTPKINSVLSTWMLPKTKEELHQEEKNRERQQQREQADAVERNRNSGGRDSSSSNSRNNSSSSSKKKKKRMQGVAAAERNKQNSTVVGMMPTYLNQKISIWTSQIELETNEVHADEDTRYPCATRIGTTMLKFMVRDTLLLFCRLL